MSGIPGLRGTGDWGTDERPKNFRESILFYKPSGSAPIFGLTSKAGKKTVDDPEYAWWAEAMNTVRLQINGALGAADTLFTVDSADPTSTTMNALYGTATHLKPGDLLMYEPATELAGFTQELVMVTEVLSDTQFTVSRGAAGTTAAAMSDDGYLTLIGSAYAEGTAAPKAVSRNPVKFSNYTQIFKDTYELTGTAVETASRTGNPWSNDKKRKSFDHAAKIEWSMMFGRANETTGDNGKPLRFMSGIRKQIPASNTTIFGAAVTGASFLDAVKPAFDFDFDGSGDSRVAFAGNKAIIELNKIVQAETGVSMELGNVIKMWGMNLQEVVFPFGTLLLKRHPLLSIHPTYQSSMFILDFTAIKYVSLKNRDTKYKDDVQAKDEDLRRGYIQTECSVMVDGGGLSCGFLHNISKT